MLSEAGQLLEQLSRIVQEREDLERAIAAMPADADIGTLVARLTGATQKFALLEAQARQLDEARDRGR